MSGGGAGGGGQKSAVGQEAWLLQKVCVAHVGFSEGRAGLLEAIVEEYWRLEEGGNVLVARQCAYHVSVLCAGWRGGDRAWCICKVRGVCMWALREGEGGNTIEEYWRLEEGDNVLVVKQCAYMYVRGWRKEKGLGRRGRKGEMGKGEAVRREGNALVCRQHCHHVSCMGKGGEARD